MAELKFKASEKSLAFLREHLPKALEADTSFEVLKMLYELIDDKGFEPPKYDKMNEFGMEADDVYDEIYTLNTPGVEG